MSTIRAIRKCGSSSALVAVLLGAGALLGPGYWLYQKIFRNVSVATVTVAEGSAERNEAEQAWRVLSSTPRDRSVVLSPGMNPFSVAFDGRAVVRGPQRAIVVNLSLEKDGAPVWQRQVTATAAPAGSDGAPRAVRADFRGLEVEKEGQYRIGIQTADRAVLLIEGTSEVRGRAREGATSVLVLGFLLLGVGGLLLWARPGRREETPA